jgi:hydroxyacyl-ACP dehydratase HTD2-like protein with hotdog domain
MTDTHVQNGVTGAPGEAELAGLCETLTALIGRSGPELRTVALRADFERFAAAIAEDGPLATEGGRAVAPLMFVCSVQDWHPRPVLGGLRADGTGADRTSFLPLEGFRLMGGGQRIEFHAPVLEGTELRIRPTLEDVTMKHGRSGDLIVLSVKTIYADGSGRPLVTAFDTLLVR